MTIAIDGRSLQGARGGIDVYTYQLLSRLFTQYTQHSYILFFNASTSFAHPFSESANLQIVHTHIPSKLFNTSLMVAHYPKLDEYLEKNTGRRIDLFFMPNMNFAAFSSRARVIVTIHDLNYIHYRDRQSLKGRWWHSALDPERLIKLCKGIITVSEHTKQDIVSTYRISPKNVSVVHLGVEDQFQSHTSYCEALPIILAFCPQEGRKNIESLIEAFARARTLNEELQSAYLVLAGVSTLPKRIQVAIQKLRISQWVRCVSYMTRERRFALLCSARVCAYPSIYEGFGLPPLEAFLAGVPVIAGAHSSIPEISGSGAWLCDPCNIADLSEGLCTLYTNEAVRKHLMQQGKDRAARYRWDETARQTVRVFENICA